MEKVKLHWRIQDFKYNNILKVHGSYNYGSSSENIQSETLVIRGTNSGGAYEGKSGTTIRLQSEKPWQVYIQHDDGEGGPWHFSKLQAEGSGKEHTLKSENWTDNSFNDLVVEIKGVPTDGTLDQKVAANQTAKVLGRSALPRW